jgi:hypothetical protein
MYPEDALLPGTMPAVYPGIRPKGGTAALIIQFV